MAAIDDPPIIKLGADDAIAGLVLSVEAHWNQTEEDWRIFLRDGVVFGIRDGMRLVATAALLPYSGSNAWISMVLVSDTHRRRGLATRLVDACLETARRNGLTSWLDATPDGAAVYGPLGFTPTLQLRRLKLVNSTQASARAPAAATLDALCARDRRVTAFRPDRPPDRLRTALHLAYRRSERMHRAGPRRQNRAPHRSLVRRSCRRSAGPGPGDRAIRDPPPPARRCRLARRVPGGIDRFGLDRRTPVPAHALRPRHRRGRGNAIRRRRP
ncbi:GNAT superfamily N-acetyltransferase [Bradyrhizobium diazoefficiens]